jgi:hypothetical protein
MMSAYRMVIIPYLRCSRKAEYSIYYYIKYLIAFHFSMPNFLCRFALNISYVK